MSHPTIKRVVEIKRQIDLVYVIMSDGTFRFRSKADIPQYLKDQYYSEVAEEVRNPFEQDAENIQRLRQEGLL